MLPKEQIKTIVMGVLAIGIIAIAYYAFVGSPMSLSGNDAASKAINYVNSKVLTGADKASIDGKVVSESGLYKFNVKVGADSFPSYVSKDGKILFPQFMKIEDVAGSSSVNQNSSTTQNPSTGNKTIGSFVVSPETVCLEGGKPVVYFFGSQTCPHCKWEHPIVQKVAKQFEGLISFHDNYDNGKDQEVFSKYSVDGYIPAFVIGCKYYRVGTVEAENTPEGELQATDTFTALICKITNNQPASVCSGVKDLVSSITE